LLKEKFGDRNIFWGAFDEQYVLPNGTKEEIINKLRIL